MQAPTAEETTGAISASRVPLQAQRHSITAAQHALRAVAAAADGEESSGGTPRAPTLDLTTMPRHGITTVVQQLSPTIGEAAATYSSDTLTRTEVPQERPQPHSPQHSRTASTFGRVPAVQAPTAEETTGAISASRVPLQAQRHSITAAQHTLRAVATAADGEESSGGTPRAPTLGLTTMPRHGIITVVQQLSPTIGEAAIHIYLQLGHAHTH